MVKKLLASLLAAALVFGTGAVLPENYELFDTAIMASAAVYGDFEYAVLSDATVQISKYNGSGATVTVPSAIDGKKVASIGEKAFFNNKTITSVSLPGSITSIGGYAFEGCINLKSVNIPDGVAKIADDTFSWCKSLTSINTKGKTYYVKVRTYKTVGGKKYYSGYSAVKKIKVK